MKDQRTNALVPKDDRKGYGAIKRVVGLHLGASAMMTPHAVVYIS